MARLRQYFASRYGSQEATSSEFENIIRYLNSAELGNQTLAELMAKVFDEDGDVALGVEFRFDAATGLEFRLDDASDWTLIADAVSIRGTPGINLGTVNGPLLSNRQQFTAGVSQVAYAYTVTSPLADLMVWINGVLQAPESYSYSSGSGTLTLVSAPATSALVTVASIRANPAESFRRIDLEAVDGQAVFPFPLEDLDEIIVFRNGIMQREGGGYDYIKSHVSSTITMTSAQTAGALITIIRISNTAINDVAGLMLEDNYCTNGLIRLEKVMIPDAALDSAKVDGLDDALAARPSITVGTSSPLTPAAGDLWIKTAASVPYMLFYDGVRWINASPNGILPSPVISNALQFVRLNATANAMEFVDIDLSSVLGVISRGAPNGVAPLDSSGLLPTSVLPSWVSRSPIIGIRAGSIVNGTLSIGIIEDKYTVDGISLALSAGTATVQLSIGGSLVGSTMAVTTTPQRLAIGNINIDASAVPKVVSLVVTGASAATDLAYNVGCLVVGD